MTETMDQNDKLPDDDQRIIELTDIIDDTVDGENDQSRTISERGTTRDHGGLLSDDAVEAALLRVIEKKYAGQLDTLFAETVEKVVKKEIEAIKQTLLRDR